jgi:hypothetical protein
LTIFLLPLRILTSYKTKEAEGKTTKLSNTPKYPEGDHVKTFDLRQNKQIGQGGAFHPVVSKISIGQAEEVFRFILTARNGWGFIGSGQTFAS